MSEFQAAPLLDLLATVGTTLVRDRFQEQPLRLRWVTLVVEQIRVQRDAVIVQCIARGPMGIAARVDAIMTIETVGDDSSVMEFAIATRNRAVEQVLSALLPTMMPRLASTLQARGIAGATVQGNRVTVEHESFVRSILPEII